MRAFDHILDWKLRQNSRTSPDLMAGPASTKPPRRPPICIPGGPPLQRNPDRCVASRRWLVQRRCIARRSPREAALQLLGSGNLIASSRIEPGRMAAVQS
jgi:hypothetical protein